MFFFKFFLLVEQTPILKGKTKTFQLSPTSDTTSFLSSDNHEKKKLRVES